MFEIAKIFAGFQEQARQSFWYCSTSVKLG
jgi:hypothetical protein